MPEFETILRQRLGAMEDPKDHPDPNTLTAFVEELLPVAERNGVFQHLSLCKQCRDVVALTLPERSFAAAAVDEEKEQIVTPLPVPRRWWFLTPRFGLVASLVAVAAGLFLVLEIPRMHQNGGSTQTAQVVQKQDAPSSPASPSSVPSPSLQANDGVANFVEPQPQSNLRASAAPPSFAGEKQDRRIAPSAIFPERKDLIVTRNQPALAAASRSRDYVNNQLLANQVFAADLIAPAQAQDLPSAPSPALRDFVFMQPGSLSQSGKATFGTAFLAGSGAGISSQGTTTVYPLTGPDRPVKTSFLAKVTGGGRLHLKRQIPSISPETAGSYAMFSPGLAKSETAEIAAKPAEPAIAGTDLGHSAAFTGGGLRGKPSALDLGANAFLWRVVQGKLLKSSDMEHWSDGYPATEGIDFSVVTASGAEVWAGGKDAALVHSKDGGLTWERITLGASAAGNITGIEVNHSTIRVTSSSGQGWLSKDGGRSWILQD
jgi:photosynthesis system II assembly factor YCF48-like protein